MYRISDSEVDYILADITSRGIRMESIRDNLLDHICILIEEQLEENGDFLNCYSSVIQTFYKKELFEIEEAASILITFKKHWCISRNRFFLLLFTIFIGPFIAYDSIWIIINRGTSGWQIPISVWGPTVTYSIWPLLMLLVIFLTPDKLDPLIPKKSTIFLGFRPLIKVTVL